MGWGVSVDDQQRWCWPSRRPCADIGSCWQHARERVPAQADADAAW